MGYDDLSREQLIARIEALEAERCAEIGAERVRHELRVHRRELETQNQALREAQVELEQSHSRYVDLYDFAPVAYLTVDRKAVVLDLNVTAAALLGVERTPAAGKPFFALAEGVDMDAFDAYLRRCLVAEGPVVGELRFATPRGTLEVEAIGTAVRDDAGEPRSIGMALIDVGPQKALERDLKRARDAERELRTILEGVARASLAMNEAIACMKGGDLPPLLREFVEQARAVLGADCAAVGIGRAPDGTFERWVVSGISSDEQVRFDGRAAGLLRAAMHADAAIRLRGDLHEHPAFQGLAAELLAMNSFLSAPIRYGGRVLGAVILANKRTAEEFSEADEFALTLLARKAAVAVAIARVLERQQRWVELFEAASRAFGEATETGATVDTIAAVAARFFGDACAVHLLDEQGCLRAAAIRGPDLPKRNSLRRAPVSLPADVREDVLARDLPRTFPKAPAGAESLLDGPTLLVALRRDDRPLGLLHVARVDPKRLFDEEDVLLTSEFSYRASAALENARLHEVARRAVRAREEMLALVTHDLRNLLNSMSASTTLLRKGSGPLGERRQGARYVDAIGRSVAHMNLLLEALRDVTMIEAGSFRVEAKPDDVRRTLTEVATIFGPRAEAKHVRLSVEVADRLPIVACDRERVHQVLANLVGNAIEHTPEGGTVTVGASAPDDAGVRIAVSDTGSGIAPQDLLHVFDRYWRKTPEGRAGTGLGLFISRAIVHAHGSDLLVESELGRGSRFVFTLPPAAGPDIVQAAAPNTGEDTAKAG